MWTQEGTHSGCHGNTDIDDNDDGGDGKKYEKEK